MQPTRQFVAKVTKNILMTMKNIMITKRFMYMEGYMYDNIEAHKCNVNVMTLRYVQAESVVFQVLDITIVCITASHV
jgi:hypothetical protein